MENKDLNYIRCQVMSHISQSADDFECEDVLRLLSDDWQCIRFRKRLQTRDNTIDAIVEALKWKKTFGVNKITEDYFPREAKQLFAPLLHGRDRNGKTVFYYNLRAINSPKFGELTTLMKQFAAFMANHIDRCVGHSGGVVVIDLKGTERLSPLNCNIHMARHILDFQHYYPRLSRTVLFVDMPVLHNWIAVAILSLCKTSVRRKIHFIKRNDITYYIEHGQLPKEFGGEGKLIYAINVHGDSLKVTMKDNLSREFIDEFYIGYNRMITKFKY